MHCGAPRAGDENLPGVGGHIEFMFLKSLEIFGFKSFADRTFINFSEGITALLGPNGCGKSNVVDAVKWVLAENKARSLRAESMEDVIFNGTDTRAPLSVAEVTLTISNALGLLPVEEDEISIKRRLYRNGENEYFINSHPVGPTAVRKLFMDTGVGKAAYSVMEQGKVDLLLSSKPEDRRYLFEEAAGISRSKSEVQEAERELERTKSNLERLTLVLSQTKKNADLLEEQAEKTKTYRKLQDERFACECDIQLLRLKELTQGKDAAESSRLRAAQLRDRLTQESAACAAQLKVNQDKIRALQDAVNEKQQVVIRIATEQSGERALERQIKEEQARSRERIASVESTVQSITERIARANEDLDSVSAEVYSKREVLEALNKSERNSLSLIEATSDEIKDNLRLIEENRASRAALDAARGVLQRDLTEITEDIVKELDTRLRDAHYSASQSKAAKDAMHAALDRMKTAVDDAKACADDALTYFKGLSLLLKALEESILSFEKTTPLFIEDFLLPDGIITKKRKLDSLIEQNTREDSLLRERAHSLSESSLELNKRLDEYKEALSALRINRAQTSSQIASCEAQEAAFRKAISQDEASLKRFENDSFEEARHMSASDEALEELRRRVQDLEAQGNAVTKELNELDARIAEINGEASEKQSELKKKQEELSEAREQLERFTVACARYDTEISALRQNFKDNASRDLSEFEERMDKITESAPELKARLTDIRKRISELPPPNLLAVEQFAEEKEKYERLLKSFQDTEKTLEDLSRVSKEIRTKSIEQFVDTYNKVRKNFHNMFRRMMNGGRAELRLSDPANVLTSGIEIFAQPPGKKLVNISLLSGGEKSMTAVALLFAIYQVRPSPFCFLDEIDAALDDTNVASFVSTLRSLSSLSQYIVITHNRKTVLGCQTMLGITMEESGVTKVIQIRLNEDTINGELEGTDQDDFVEEEVEAEEGIVIPPRPPRVAARRQAAQGS